MRRIGFLLLLILLIATAAHAQLLPFPLGSNRPDVSWRQIETGHFTIIYHQGLDAMAREAADVAEAIYPVVTGNLRTEMPDRTPIYLSDLDDVPNAFALDNKYIYIWMRGILDDMPLGGIRSGGHAKWFRSVITHEFTHIVIAQATRSWINDFFPTPDVPRWFNEGTARFMEPDGWTTDIDMVLRVAAVNARLGYDLLNPGRLDGTLLYETGHSLVRYMTARFGDTVLAKILHGGHGSFSSDFYRGVQEATGMSMSEIYSDWKRTVTVLYGAEYYGREEVVDISKPLTRSFEIVGGLRFSPDGRRVAMLAADQGDRQKLYLMPVYRPDSLGPAELLSDEPGFDQEFSWSPDGTRLVLSKQRFGSHEALVHDLYILDVGSRKLRRLIDDGALTDPAWSPDGTKIVAVEKRLGRDNLVLVDPATGARSRLTTYDADVQIYTPSWSPDGRRIAFSLFDTEGNRAIAVMPAEGGEAHTLTNDSANNRYPVWSPDGGRIAFTSHAGGVPNLQLMNADGSDRHYLTDAAGGLYSVQWLPAGDSIVAISFDSRDRILPHLIPADRRVMLSPVPSPRPKYLVWQSARLPLRVPAPSEITAAAISDSGGYSALAHIQPQILALPIASSDISRDGGRREARFGLATAWSDPMVIHSIIAYMDYGIASHEFGGEFYYLNNYLPFTITGHIDYSLGFERVVADSAYFQRNRTGELSLEYATHGADALDITHHFSLMFSRRNIEPYGVTRTADITRTPVAAKLTELLAGYRYSSNDYFLSASFRRAEPALGSELRYNRLDAHAAAKLSFSDDDAIVAQAGGTAQWGEQLPQEFIGLDRYDQLQGGFNLPTLLDLRSIQGSYRVRGIRRYLYGDRVMTGSIGLQTRLEFLENLLPLLSAFQPHTLLFAEAGSAWFSDSTSLKEIPILAGYGIELRSQLLPNLFLSAGIAFEMIARPRRDLYVRLSAGL
jgi:Tol biopolymer transport system component